MFVESIWVPFDLCLLLHRDRVSDICITKLGFGLDNGLSPFRRQTIIQTNYGILLILSPENKLQWGVSQKTKIFLHENGY